MNLYTALRPIVGFVFKIVYRFEVIDGDRIPKEGPVIICPNHWSNADPVFVAGAIRRDIKWMAKEELFRNKFARFFLNKFGAFPVKRNTADITAIKRALEVLKSGGFLGIFIEGKRVSSIEYENAKSGPITLAQKTGAVIVPVYIEGNYKLFSKMKLYVREPIDFKGVKKLTSDEQHSLSVEVMKRIYEGVEIY